MARHQHFRVIGSAPDVEIHTGREGEWLTCVNASIARVETKPSLWVITDQIFDHRKNANQAALALMKGRSCKHLLIVRRMLTEKQAIERLSNLDINYNEIRFVGNIGRSFICQYYCGLQSIIKHRRPSNGVFAIILCMVAVKSGKCITGEVVSEGIDPGSVEHFYSSGWKKRGHIDADRRAFENLRKETALRILM